MCGIAGYCGPDKRFSEEKLQAMLCAIRHRGPDDSGTFSAQIPGTDGLRLWMGARRLAIQDLSPAGHQPMVDAATGSAIAFNGEIYNFQELKAGLERGGTQFHSRCDTEVALRSWCLQGLDAVGQWRGMFGAAVWDAQAKELWLLRDPWGIKPLYYRCDGEGLAFCSEIRGLLAVGVAPRELSQRGIEDYLRFGAPQDPVTIINGVYALLPGHALRWSAGKIEIRRYAAASPAAEDGAQAAARGARAGDAGNVDPMLREIVRQQLIADVPLVVFLSGGVDSSVVSLLARQEGGPGVHTMAVVFEESGYSERDFARRVAAKIGTEHREVLLTGEQARTKALEAISRMDQPSMDGINTYVVSEAAKRSGFTVALSGLGGDEFFGGYDTFERTGRLRTLQQLARRAPGAAEVAGRAMGWWKGAAGGKLSLYLRGGDFWEHPYFMQRTLFFPGQIEELCVRGAGGHAAGRAGVRTAEADRLAEARRESVLQEAEALDPLNQVSLLEARTYMANVLLRDSDQMSMAHSLELRVPLVDPLLAAWLLSVPGERKGFGRARKLWLREAFGPSLPAEVFERKKMGFTLPFSVWLRGPLSEEVGRTLNESAGDLWNRDAVRQVWEQFHQGRVSWSRPWALYVLSRWAAEHVYGG